MGQPRFMEDFRNDAINQLARIANLSDDRHSGNLLFEEVCRTKNIIVLSGCNRID